MTKSEYYDKLYQDRLNKSARIRANNARIRAERQRQDFIYSQNRLHDGYKVASFGFLKLIAILMLVSIMFKFISGSSQNMTFTGFLSWIQNADFTLIDGSFIDNTIGGYWVLADGIRIFLNTIISVFDVLSWVARNGVNAIYMAGQFMAYFFGITGMSGATG